MVKRNRGTGMRMGTNERNGGGDGGCDAPSTFFGRVLAICGTIGCTGTSIVHSMSVFAFALLPAVRGAGLDGQEAAAGVVPVAGAEINELLRSMVKGHSETERPRERGGAGESGCDAPSMFVGRVLALCGGIGCIGTPLVHTMSVFASALLPAARGARRGGPEAAAGVVPVATAEINAPVAWPK